MTVDEFIHWIEKAKKYAKAKKTSEIEFWYGNKMLDIESIGHFHVIPDIAVHFKKKK